jgi:hypothetical protein
LSSIVPPMRQIISSLGWLAFAGLMPASMASGFVT